MSGVAISSFVDGFFRGRDWRNSQEDRKDNKKRQQRMDDLREREFGLREDDFNMRRERFDAEMAEYERDRTRRNEEQEFFKSLGSELGAVRSGQPQQADRSAAPLRGNNAPPLTFGTMGAPTGGGGGGGGADMTSGDGHASQAGGMANDRLQQPDTATIMAMVIQDPAVVMMAERQGMAPEDYVRSLHPKAQQQLVANIQKRGTFDKRADTNLYQQSQFGVGSMGVAPQADAAPQTMPENIDRPNAHSPSRIPRPAWNAPATPETPTDAAPAPKKIIEMVMTHPSVVGMARTNGQTVEEYIASQHPTFVENMAQRIMRSGNAGVGASPAPMSASLGVIDAPNLYEPQEVRPNFRPTVAPRQPYGKSVAFPEPQGVSVEEASTSEQAQSRDIQAVDPARSAFIQDMQTSQRKADIRNASREIAQDIAGGRDGGVQTDAITRTIGGAIDYFTETPEAGKANVAERKRRSSAVEWYRSDDAMAFFSENPDALAAAKQDPVTFFEEFRKGERAAQDGKEAPQPVAAAQEAVATTPAPQAGAEAQKTVIPQVAYRLGVQPGQKMTPKQIDSGGQMATDWYIDNAAPRIMEFYIARGEMDKALAYSDLIESRAGKKALKARGKAIFKLVNGDIDGGATDMLEAWKSFGYIDPTFDIDEDATGVKTDNRGVFKSAKIVFRDRNTGDTFEKAFDSETELIDYTVTMTSPETVVEMLDAQRAAQPRLGALNDVQKSIIETTQGLLGQKDISGNPVYTPEQARQLAIETVMAATGNSGLGTLGAGQGVNLPQPPNVNQNGLYREPS